MGTKSRRQQKAHHIGRGLRRMLTLKKLLAEAMLDNAALKDIASGNF
jgi:hypothetical protein